MKNLFSIAVFSFLLFSCNPNEKKNEDIEENDYATYHCSKEYQERYSKLLNLEEMLSVYKVGYEFKEEEKSGEDGMYLIHWNDNEGKAYEMGIKSISFFEKTMDSIDVRTKFDERYKRKFEQLNNVLSDGKEQSKSIRTWGRVLDIGDHAWFDFKEKELEILAGRTKFIVKVNLGDDRDMNLKIATMLGQKALEKCH